MNRRLLSRLYAVVLCLIILVLYPATTRGQEWRIKRYEAGLGLGTIHAYTDIGPASKVALNFINGSRPNVTTNLAFRVDPHWNVNLDLSYVMFGGGDVDSDSHFRPDYNWAYTTHALEHTLRVEYYILGDFRRRGIGGIYNRRGMVNTFKRKYLYVFLGGGGVMTKARLYERGNYKNELVGTTGYENNLKWSPVIPGGIGFKYSYSPNWNFGAELGYRYTFTDWLDGYSDDYWGDYKDYYYLFTVKAIYKVRTTRSGLPQFSRFLRSR